ncbi:aminotransferase class I/II-fold pyridoxal phosphate-dependent enzyme [Streptomyces sp. NPDC059003]|uniref:aminotransferase class I/II-fold pyridoxal phosphate-dependent enzyme n=1 Tax=Streptomyces sp. NPDC059003 TaxID=3346691 RepID=UPI0036AC72A9
MRHASNLVRDPSRVQGGDLTDLPEGAITLDLSICSNRFGPPPEAIAALADLITRQPDSLTPPPYRAQTPYLEAFARRLHTDTRHMLAGCGVTEFLAALARLLTDRRVAVITPEYTGTLEYFAYADFLSADPGVQDTPEMRFQRTREAMMAYEYVVLSNPSNPLGHYIPRNDLLRVCTHSQHRGATLIVDEEYIAFQGNGRSLAGTDLSNLVVLQSTGKANGMPGTRAGMLWTRDTHLRGDVQRLLLPWLYLLDITAATAALQDNAWLPGTLAKIKSDAQRLQQLLQGRFGARVSPADIHYRFVHLDNPYPAHRHLLNYRINTRLFSGDEAGTVPGLRLAAPSTEEEFDQVQAALETLTAGDENADHHRHSCRALRGSPTQPM